MMAENEDRIISVVSKEIARGRNKFIIYPFGEMGKLVKQILNSKFSLSEELIVDNGKAKSEDGQKIYPVEYLASYDMSDKYVLVCSNRPDIFVEIRKVIRSCVPRKKIIDVFERYEFVGKEYWDHIAKISALSDENICSLKRYDVKFYLPLWRTDWIQSYILRNDCYYEDEYLFYVTRVFRGGMNLEGRTVLDAGANIGNHSLYFLKECKAKKVIAFEPIKETYEILEKNIEINELQDRVALYNCGLGDENVNAFANGYNIENIGGTSLREASDGNIEIHTLDDLGFDDDIALMKIDVEGFEGKVIKGALRTIEKCRPVIMLENWEIETSYYIVSVLSGLGYDFKQVNESNYVFFQDIS